jgi:hypothetical protein
MTGKTIEERLEEELQEDKLIVEIKKDNKWIRE